MQRFPPLELHHFVTETTKGRVRYPFLLSSSSPLLFNLSCFLANRYQNHFVGKGHLGYQTMDHLPINRGFLTHVGYLAGSEDYYHGKQGTVHDMWLDRLPGFQVVKEMDYSANYYSTTAAKLIEQHDQTNPMFMYFAIQNVHSPYELPEAFETKVLLWRASF